jgi:indoleamine 2,3-dioxygenase
VLARRWYAVASRLRRPPVLSYASYALDNWRRIDPTDRLRSGNIALLQNFPGGLDEEWFVTLHVYIEAQTAPALAALPRAQALLVLRILLVSPLNCTSWPTLSRTCTAPFCARPKTATPTSIPASPSIHPRLAAPSGCDAGVDAYAGQPQKFHGETGAQSTIIPCLDAALGIRHPSDGLRVYLQAMRQYMPRGHVAFLEQLESRSSVVRDFVAVSSDADLRVAYDRCVQLVEAFRATHLDYAARYIHEQGPVGVNSTTYGTGGTPFVRYLKKHRGETRAHRLAG